MFRKVELLELGSHLGLGVKYSMKKPEISKVISEFLVKEKLLCQQTSVEDFSERHDAAVSKEVTAKTLELRRMELDHQREKESKDRELQLVMKEKELQLQLQLKEIELKTGATYVRNDSQFDLSKNVRMLPPFREQEIDSYFLHFEKIATSLKWPKDMWTMLLQSVLTGKARQVFSSLSLEQSCDYQLVKKAILSAYELVPEAYRQKFRKFQKTEAQTYVEFSRQKEMLFDRWCASQDAKKDFAKLRELTILEEFKSSVSTEICTYLDERKVSRMEDAALLAYEYCLSHTTTFNKKLDRVVKEQKDEIGLEIRTDDASAERKFEVENKKESKKVPTCFHCKKKGHTKSSCWFLIGFPNKKPTGLIKTMRSMT